MQDWQQMPETLNGLPSSNPSPNPSSSQQALGASPSPRRQFSSPGTDPESQDPSQRSPGPPPDQPAGIDSDDNFEVSDDADEQQVFCASQPACTLACLLACLLIALLSMQSAMHKLFHHLVLHL